jgi:orotidine-5'-phosphate decarboxylase
MKIIAVTVLTSLDHERMGEVGMKGEPEKEARRLAKVALKAGADGVVCSPLEVPAMRDRFGDGPLLVVPGIRPAGFDAGDQKRILTPGEAARAGASHLVVGRPIIEAADPSAVYDRILDEIRAPAE